MDRVAGAGALLAVLVGGALFVAVLAVLPSGTAPPADSGWIGPDIWTVRGLDLAAQALLILAGVFGVLVVLGREAAG